MQKFLPIDVYTLYQVADGFRQLFLSYNITWFVMHSDQQWIWKTWKEQNQQKGKKKKKIKQKAW